MTEEQIEVTEQVDEQPAQETPDIDELLEKARELDELRAKIAEQEASSMEQEIQSKFEQAGVTNFDKLRPFLNPKKLNGDSLDELVAVLSGVKPKPKPKPVGSPTNGGPTNERAVYEAQLQDAATVAKRSGRAEDVAYYTKLKQTLQKFGGNR
ncbi:hypothetical protein [Lysinibacillus sp. fls2-241-R2A-57]|uniref:hypothetical protein n=1 Tax=Lysinibacillus sp. fls2-241-R2A-57 TaxID=3040292 RepID=UPI0025529B0B|nr:hypothetical protein [Lysinibacillus sp. fls2-241-R2A-57]